MEFREWLLTENDKALESVQEELKKSNPMLYYVNDNGTRKWVGYDLGERFGPWKIIEVRILRNSKQIYIELVSPHHPELRPALKQLSDLIGKEILGYRTRFDGPPGMTLGELISQERDEDWDYMEFFYHGTCTGFLKVIEREGLRPRSETGTPPVHGRVFANAPLGPENQVYLCAEDGNKVRFAAREANVVFHRLHPAEKSEPVILKINARELNLRKLKPDHDSGKYNWQDSLYTLGSVGYEGIIPPNLISIHLVYDSATNGWKKP